MAGTWTSLPPSACRVRSDVPSEGGKTHHATQPRERTLRIRVFEAGFQKVDIAIPLAVARVGKVKLGGLVRCQLEKFGVDLDDVMRKVDQTGRVLNVAEGADRVEVSVD